VAAVIRVILAILAGIAVSTLLPREAGRELHLAVRWDLSLDGRPVPADIAVESEPETFIARTEGRFALVETDSGRPLVTGLRPPIFEAATVGFIGQSSDAPRWAVQSWDGRMITTANRFGVPRLHDALLLQFGEDHRVFLSSLDGTLSGEFFLPEGATVYDLTRTPDGVVYLAAGAVDGTLSVVSSASSLAWSHQFDFQRYSGESPVVYSLSFLAGNPDAVPRLLVVQGLHPQRVLLAELREDGTIGIEPVFTVPTEQSVRWPTTIHVDEDGHVVIPLLGSVAMADTETEGIRLLSVPGSTAVVGALSLAGGRRLIAGERRGGAYLLIDEESRDTTVTWPLPGLSAAHVAADAPLVVVRRGDRFLGVEVTL
jgi:hypothetical protein